MKGIERGFCGVAIVHIELVEDTASIGALRDENSCSGHRTIDIDTEELFDCAEVAYGELLGKMPMYPVDFLYGFGENQDVVDIYCNNSSDSVLSSVPDEDAFVCIRLMKS